MENKCSKSPFSQLPLSNAIYVLERGEIEAPTMWLLVTFSGQLPDYQLSLFYMQ